MFKIKDNEGNEFVLNSHETNLLISYKEAKIRLDSKALSGLIEFLIDIRQQDFKCIHLTNEKFKKTWELWEIYRKSIKKPLTKVTRNQHFKKLNKTTLEKATKILEMAMDKGWQSFEVEWYNKCKDSFVSKTELPISQKLPEKSFEQDKPLRAGSKH